MTRCAVPIPLSSRCAVQALFLLVNGILFIVIVFFQVILDKAVREHLGESWTMSDDAVAI